MLMSLLLTSSLFTIALTSLPQIGALLAVKQDFRDESSATFATPHSGDAPVINVHINQPPASTKQVIVNVIITPAQPSSTGTALQPSVSTTFSTSVKD